jgi:glutathione peroxidase
MSILDVPINRLDGTPVDLTEFAGDALLVVNVASKCGLTPQYTALQALQQTYGDRGFTVLGFPCNQFLGQEPGTPEEIAEFCSVNYDVTFPLFEKIDVNGDERHPLYQELVDVPDSADGYTGDIRWNFEKFVVAPGGRVVARFNPQVKPDDPAVTDAVERALPASTS